MIEDSMYFKIVNDKFPKIGTKIKLFWGHPEFVSLMHELQQDNRLQPRAGFPSDVLLALHELENDHNLIWPKLARQDRNIWIIDGH